MPDIDVALFIQNSRGKHGLDDAEDRQQHDHADNIEHQMHNGRALGVLLLVPTQEISAVTQVPMFWPMIIGIAAGVADLAGRRPAPAKYPRKLS